MAGGTRPPGARAAALQESPIHKANTCSPPPASPHPRAAWGGCVWQPSRCPRRVLAAPGLSSPTTRLGRTEETKRLVARYVNQTSPFGARLSDILCLESFCGENRFRKRLSHCSAGPFFQATGLLAAAVYAFMVAGSGQGGSGPGVLWQAGRGAVLIHHAVSIRTPSCCSPQ